LNTVFLRKAEKPIPGNTSSTDVTFPRERIIDLESLCRGFFLGLEAGIDFLNPGVVKNEVVL